MKNKIKNYGTIISLTLAIALFLLSGLLPQGFKDVTQAYIQLMDILRISAFLGIIAAGQTLVVISGYGGIDLSVGSVVTISAVMTYGIMDGKNLMIFPALLVILGVGACIGFLNGLGIIYLKISPLIMTLAMAGVVQGLVLVTTQGVYSGGISKLISDIISRPLILAIPGVVIIWILFGLFIWLLLERTSYGKQSFSIGTNRIASHLSGVNVNRMTVLTYTLASIMAAFGGFLLVGYTRVVLLEMGNPYLFPSIAAVAIGGTLFTGGKGSYFGTMVGAIILTLMSSILTTLQMPQSIRQIVMGIILLFILLAYGRQQAIRQ